MGRVHEDFKQENYTIPIHTVGGSTRPDALSSTSGVSVIAISGSDSLGTLSLIGTRYGSTKIEFEELTVSTTAGSTSLTTDWTNIYGMRFGNIEGRYSNALTGFSTVSCDVSLVSAANTSHELARISSGSKATKSQLYRLRGQNVTLSCISGTPLYNTKAIVPTSNNAFRISTGDSIDTRIEDYLFVNSDTSGSSVQVKIWKD